LNIAKLYGSLNKNKDGFQIPEENLQKVNCELNDLFNLEQDVNITMIKLSSFDNIDLTY
jgi:hypothetical protein